MAEPYIAVAGGVNVDVGGRSFAPLTMRDSNPGAVTVSLGGVGRNIAHNLRRLGVRVELLTAIGGDGYAQRVEASCAALGIGLSHALRVPEGRTSTYLYLSGPDGDMALALADMAICDELTDAYFEARLPVLNGAALVVADANLPEAALRFLAEHCASPLFVDPVSTAKAWKVVPILPRIHTLKPNRFEAELLSGVAIDCRESAERAAEALLARGVKRVFLSMGENGLLAADGEDMLWQPPLRAEPRSATGAGDAMMAALAWAFLHGESLGRSAACGAAAASIAVESEETVNAALSEQTVRARCAWGG